jgi:PhnB protein
MGNKTTGNAAEYSLASWLSVRNSLKALDFYKTAFGAEEVYRLDVPDGIIARLSVHGAEFWIAQETPEEGNVGTETLGGKTVRMILTVPDPDAVFAQAIAAGATEVFPVGEGHGWRLGRVIDPFGLHWEIGRLLS